MPAHPLVSHFSDLHFHPYRLTSNYAPYPDGNVPRQGLYFSYRRVCDQYGIPHINTATLGKAIRLCFPTIKTRRLGVRGNSKYHCSWLLALPCRLCRTNPFFFLSKWADCGIRPATSAEAEFLQDYIRKTNNQAAQRSVDAARIANEQSDVAAKVEERSDEDDEEESEDSQSATASKRNSLNFSAANKGGPMFCDEKTPTAGSLLAQAQAASQRTLTTQAPIRRHAGPHEGGNMPVSSSAPTSAFLTSSPPNTSSSSIRLAPQFPSIEEAIGTNSTSPEGVAAREVWGWFVDHLDALLESIRAFRTDQFEMHLRQFWSSLSGNHREVVHAPAVAGLMAKADAMLYDVSGSKSALYCSIQLIIFFSYRKSWKFFVLKCCRPSRLPP
jgi:regulatory factor X, other